MTIYLKTDNEHLLRDSSSSALINKDINALSSYKKARKKDEEFKRMKQTIENLENKVDKLLEILSKR